MTTYYVSDLTGNDDNKGTLTSPFKTIQEAINLVKAGDTVYVLNGNYEQKKYPNSPVVGIINKQGTADAPITLSAYPGHKPVINSINFQAILISASSYIVVDGLTLIGANDQITLEYAESQKENETNALTNGGGIIIKPDRSGKISHHITIRNNNVSKFPGGGIAAIESDYLIIENNIVSFCAWYSLYGTQGITLLNLYNLDNNTTSYKNIVRGNVCYSNYNYIPWIRAGKVTEGHGIMIDLSKSPGLDNQEYKGKTLITNNTCYKNGGAGIQVFKSSNVDVINNTTYQNSQHSGLVSNGEIFINGDSDNVIVKFNILYAKPNGFSYVVNGKTDSVKAESNLIYNTTKYNKSAVKTILNKDPKFTNVEKNDFTLQLTSPAYRTEIKQEKQTVIEQQKVKEIQTVQELQKVTEIQKVKKLVEIEVEEPVEIEKLVDVQKEVEVIKDVPVEKVVNVEIKYPLGANK